VAGTCQSINNSTCVVTDLEAVIDQWTTWRDGANPALTDYVLPYVVTHSHPTNENFTPEVEIPIASAQSIGGWTLGEIQSAVAATDADPPKRLWHYQGKRPQSGVFMTEASGIDQRMWPWMLKDKGFERGFYWFANQHSDLDNINGDQGSYASRFRNLYEEPWTFGRRYQAECQSEPAECQVVDVCAGAVPGTACTINGQAGVCINNNPYSNINNRDEADVCAAAPGTSCAGGVGQCGGGVGYYSSNSIYGARGDGVCHLNDGQPCDQTLSDGLTPGSCLKTADNQSYCQFDTHGFDGPTQALGDGAITYPGKDFYYPQNDYGVNGLFASRRMKMWRRGLQDAEYITMAEAVSASETQKCLDDTFPTTVQDGPSPEATDILFDFPTTIEQSSSCNGVSPCRDNLQRGPISWSEVATDWDVHQQRMRDIIESGSAGCIGDQGGTGGAGGAPPPPVCSGGSFDTPDDSATTNFWAGNSTGFAAANDQLTAEIWVRNGGTVTDDQGVGVSRYSNTETYGQIPAIVRFNNAVVPSQIQAHDSLIGPSYSCSNDTGAITCPSFLANTWYKVRFEINLTGQTYDAYVEDCSGTLPQTKIANDHALRCQNQGGVSACALEEWQNIQYFRAWSDTNASIDLNWTDGLWSETCTPLTCADYDSSQGAGDNCGSPPDNCGGTLTCAACGTICDDNYQCCVQDPSYCTGKCGNTFDNCGVAVSCGNDDCGDGTGGDVCISNVCCTPDNVTACSGLNCGSVTNNCQQSVSCGSCGTGEICESGTCVSTSSKPTASNTGPTDVGALTPLSSTTITVNGTTLENFEMTGGSRLDIDADNVTIRNFRIDSSALFCIDVSAVSGLVLEDGEVTGCSAGIKSVGGITMRRMYLHDFGTDAIKVDGSLGVLVEDSFVEKVGRTDGKGDAVQTIGGANMTFRNNNFNIPKTGVDAQTPTWPSNATFHFSGNNSTNILIENNWLNGGNYTLYCGKDGTGGVDVVGNRFGRGYQFGLIQDPCDSIIDNVWDDTGECIPNNSSCTP
jgi:hypothetical protein